MGLGRLPSPAGARGPRYGRPGCRRRQWVGCGARSIRLFSRCVETEAKSWPHVCHRWNSGARVCGGGVAGGAETHERRVRHQVEERKHGPTVDGGDTKAQTPGPEGSPGYLGLRTSPSPSPGPDSSTRPLGMASNHRQSRWAHGRGKDDPTVLPASGALGDESTGQNIWPCPGGVSGVPSGAALPPGLEAGTGQGGGGVREQWDAALPDLVVAQTQHLQRPRRPRRPLGTACSWLWSRISSAREACRPRKDTLSMPSSRRLLWARCRVSRPASCATGAGDALNAVVVQCQVAKAPGRKEGTCTSWL